jgi:DNA-binding transcriptional regulator YdaS (Cro superfamily)
MATEDDVKEALRKECAGHGAQAALARRCGVTRAYVHDMLSGRREVSDAVLKELGFERLVTYRRLR